MDANKQTILWLGATRYYMGRRTYAVGDFCDLLIAEWPNLDDSTKALIRRDITEEIARDDAARIEGWKYNPLGDDCDRADWNRVAKLWANV